MTTSILHVNFAIGRPFCHGVFLTFVCRGLRCKINHVVVVFLMVVKRMFRLIPGIPDICDVGHISVEYLSLVFFGKKKQNET